MRKFRPIATHFWMSPKIQALSVETRLIALYLIAGPHTSALGCFRLPKDTVAEDLNLSLHEVSEGFDVLTKRGMLHADPENNWVFLLNFFTFNPLQNANHVRQLEPLLSEVPLNSIFVPELLRVLGAHVEQFDASFKKHVTLLEKYHKSFDEERASSAFSASKLLKSGVVLMHTFKTHFLKGVPQ
jgi:hypothetical protein